MPPIFIALGSNIDPEENLKAAATMLRAQFPYMRFSSVYRSAPVHREDQPDFLNAVSVAETEESPQEIHTCLTDIERHLKKNLPFRFGPRTIDLDLLLYGNAIQSDREIWPNMNSQLVLPHPRMHERRFVLEPLLELLDPQERHPVLGKTWKELLRVTAHQEIQCTKIII